MTYIIIGLYIGLYDNKTKKHNYVAIAYRLNNDEDHNICYVVKIKPEFLFHSGL